MCHDKIQEFLFSHRDGGGQGLSIFLKNSSQFNSLMHPAPKLSVMVSNRQQVFNFSCFGLTMSSRSSHKQASNDANSLNDVEPVFSSP